MTNTLYTADNISVMRGMNSDSVDLIYLDPPFNSKRTYSAPLGSQAAGASFKDMWTWEDVDEDLLQILVKDYPDLVSYITTIGGASDKAMMSYCLYMAQRIIEMRRILKPTGSLYLHVDPTASHYLKIILDAVFGAKNFRREIIWSNEDQSGFKSQADNWIRGHDTILYYVAGQNPTFNKEYRPLDERTIRRYDKIDEKGDRYKIYRDKKKDGAERKVYLKADRGTAVPSVWTDIYSFQKVNNTGENTGYPTQKPLALLRRIIEASSKEGDVVLDPFCGCATTCVAAQQLQRTWIGIDIEEYAATILLERLQADSKLFTDFIHLNALANPKKLPKRTDIKEVDPDSRPVKNRLYEEQEKKCNGCKTEFNILNMTIDHVIPKSKGGGNHIENYQLLCAHCNATKNNRPMQYLLEKIRKREDLLRSQFSF